MHPGIDPAALPLDTHEAQAMRFADHCERYPGRWFTVRELGDACDVACASKVISRMCRSREKGGLGYVVLKDWRPETCMGGTRRRRRGVRVYRVIGRPSSPQLSLLD